MGEIYGVIIKSVMGEEYLSDYELSEAIEEYYAEEKVKAEIKKDEYPLKGFRCTVCGSSTQ